MSAPRVLIVDDNEVNAVIAQIVLLAEKVRGRDGFRRCGGHEEGGVLQA